MAPQSREQKPAQRFITDLRFRATEDLAARRQRSATQWRSWGPFACLIRNVGKNRIVYADSARSRQHPLVSDACRRTAGPACRATSRTSTRSDCRSQSCSSGVCIASCFDGVQNQNETSVDCGGSTCDGCHEGLGCSANSDCFSGPPLLVCQSGACSSHCLDSTTDGDESDTDCGGFDCSQCGNGQACGHASDCVSNNCGASNTCQP